MNPNIIDPLPAGALTWGGKTRGPAINLGRLRPHMIGGRLFYLHLDELRDFVVKAGWHTEQDYQQVATELSIVKNAHSSVTKELLDAHEKIETLEKALGWKPEAPKAAPKPKAKAGSGNQHQAVS